MDDILQVKKINKSYRDLKAVDNVSFEVCPGEILGLLGPNGAGKTSIIRMIMDILEPDSGEIIFNGVRGTGRPDKKQMGYLPEERGIYGETKVMETILYFAELNNFTGKKARSEAEKWLERLELSDHKDRQIEQLSKGMQQKVQFIISMIHKPRLLVLDELFSGLDPVNQELFKDIVKDLIKDGITILLSSHRMNLVEELCDRIFLINEGRRVLYGNLEEIKEGAGIKEVELVISSGQKPGKIAENEVVNNFHQEGNKVKFDVSSDVNIQSLIGDIPDDIVIKELSITNPSMHSIFVNTVQGGDFSA